MALSPQRPAVEVYGTGRGGRTGALGTGSQVGETGGGTGEVDRGWRDTGDKEGQVGVQVGRQQCSQKVRSLRRVH